jgi:hypothetical protein
MDDIGSTSTLKACHQTVTKCLVTADALANALNERKHWTKLGLSKYAAQAAERAGESAGDLGLSRNVRDVAAIGSTLWPEDHKERHILNIAFLTGQASPRDPEKGEILDSECPDSGR